MDWRMLLIVPAIGFAPLAADYGCQCCEEPDEPFYSDHQTNTWPGKKEDSFYDSLTGG